MNQFRKLILKIVLKKSEIQLLDKGYSDEDRDDIKNWLINILPRIIKDYRDNCKGYPKPLNPDSNISFDLSSRDKWVEILNKIINYFNESSSIKCHWKNKFHKGTKRYLIEQDKINSYRVKCLHKALRILDFYIEEMHKFN